MPTRGFYPFACTHIWFNVCRYAFDVLADVSHIVDGYQDRKSVV